MGLTSLEKCDFLGLWKITFFRAKKRFLFYLAHYLTIFLVLFWPKTTQEKKYIFWRKAWVNPFGKMRFLGLKNIDFLWPKKVSFLSRTLLNIIFSLILTKNNSRKNYIFWPKAWVNPFGKMRFLGLGKITFFITKKGFFSFYNIIKHYF